MTLLCSVMPRHHRRLLSLHTDGSFACPREQALFAQAWCTTVRKMSGHQRRHSASELLILAQQYLDVPIPDEQSAVAPSVQADELLSLAKQLRPSNARGTSQLDRRISWLAQLMGMDDVDMTILAVLARVALLPEWDELLNTLPGQGHNLDASRIALLTALSSAAVSERLTPGSPLLIAGLVNDDRDGEFSAGSFLLRVARSCASPTQLARHLMPPAPASTLRLDDYAHLGAEREIAERLVKRALGRQEGASLLLYGGPGTGKTEFARLLATQAGARAVFAGLADERGGEPSPSERLTHLRLLRALSRHRTDRLLVVDEADDVLAYHNSRGRESRSKQWLNCLVEADGTPTVWIVNDVGTLDPSIVRRMDLAIEFPRPSRLVRQRVVERHARKHRLRLTQAQSAELAALPASPATLGSAVRAAKRAGGGAADAQAIGEALVTAIDGRPPTPHRLPHAYDPALACADTDLAALADRLTAASNPGWSLLLSGPSGTGKSAYARYLAERLGIELIEKRGSDLLSMYVGGTEAALARAFHETGHAGALLLIDEADDFLFDRRSARHSWERSATNELLRQMEALSSPFVATTNLADRLDPAAQRRFTMRAAFEPLDEVRAGALFRRWFGCDLPALAAPLTEQTPGDFAVVARRAAFLGEAAPHKLLQWLREEAAARSGSAGPLGF